MTRYDFCRPRNENGLGVVCLEEKFGVFNYFKGAEILPPVYDDVCILDNDCFSVKHGNTWGAVTSDGKAICSPIFQNVNNFDEDFLLLNIDTKHLCLTRKNNSIKCSNYYSRITNFINGFAIVCQSDWTETNWYGIIDKDLNEVIPPIYRHIVHYRDDLFLAVQNSKVYVINSKNEIQQELEYTGIIKPFNTDYYITLNQSSYGIMYRNLIVILPAIYEYISPLNSTTFKVRIKGRYGIGDISHGIILQPQYESISQLTDNLLRVEDFSKSYALFTIDGKQLTPFQYKELTVKRKYIIGKRADANNCCDLIDINGNVLAQMPFDDITPIENCFAVYSTSNFKYGICDSDYSLVSKVIYDGIININTNNKAGIKCAEVRIGNNTGYFYW